MSILGHLSDVARGKAELGVTRSGKWPEVRARHLLAHPRCEVCGGAAKLEVHHIQPYSMRPELELDGRNLITLCESSNGGVNCHLAVGHLGDYKCWNPTVAVDAAMWRNKILSRSGGWR